jgi:hypothetical protein
MNLLKDDSEPDSPSSPAVNVIMAIAKLSIMVHATDDGEQAMDLALSAIHELSIALKKMRDIDSEDEDEDEGDEEGAAVDTDFPAEVLS